MKILFMGTPDFAVPVLEALIAADKTIAELAAPLTILPQVLKNVRVADKAASLADAEVQAAIAAADDELGEDGRIEEAAYQGHGCAISQASADMMSDLMIDKTPEEALELCDLFERMVRGEVEDEAELERLEDAALLCDIAHMPARVKCAELAWRTLSEMLTKEDEA